MSRFLFAAAFLLGTMAIVWVGASFIGSHALALTVTAIIGAVYTLGVLEMFQFRRATSTLSKALASIPDHLSSLDGWLDRLHPSLQNSVRLRIEGERVGLPGPALTPYLVGLLVMLGMLGTFVGMVVTLNGAVFALEGTTDLQAIRSGLAAPIKGLGLAFGTSVAGVAASAMLGLISTLSRRERMLTAQLLDKKVATVLRGFSLAHNRQETFKALQLQAHALPEVVDKLQAMAVQMERMSNHLNERLFTNQESFHTSVKRVYSELAQSVEKSLKESLAESGRLAGESIKPIVEGAMASIVREAQNTHGTLINAAQTQIDGFSERFGHTAKEVANTWKDALANHEHSNEGLVNGMRHSLEAFNEKFEHTSETLLTSFTDASATLIANQASNDQSRLDLWVGSFESMAATLNQEWQQSGEHTLSQQQKICTALEATAREITENAKSSSSKMHNEMDKLLSSSEDLIRSRKISEESWIKEAKNTHEKLISAAQAQLEGFSERFSHTATTVANTWKDALTSHEHSNEGLVSGMRRSLEAFNEKFEYTSMSLLASFKDASSSMLADQTSGDQKRLDLWMGSLESMAATLKCEWQQSAEHALSQQQHICVTLEATAREITENAQSNSSKMLNEITQLLNASEDLIRTRMASEEAWIKQHGERMDQLATLLRAELGTLRDEEAARGKAAVEQLAGLQSALASHLATLGTALEAPMTRLIHTASEAPRAAAEVIGQLRQEISNNSARDNQLLDERNRIMESLDTLLISLNNASAEQRTAIETLVNSSAELLSKVGTHFTEQVGAEASKLSDIAAHVTGSAVEVSSLSEAFGYAVQRFSESNEKLIENLHRIEGSLDKSTTRSDEQLAYYVAQAREIIDLSLLSQKEIFEELRQLKPHKDLVGAEET